MTYANFEWPLPPGYELVPGDDFTGAEPAFLALASGRKIQGSLSRFLPTHGVLEFLPSRGRTNVDVPLADVLQLRLTRPLHIRPSHNALPEALSAGAPGGKQLYRVELVSAEVLEAETHGFTVHPAGLFLYTENYGGTVIRAFLPAGAIRTQQIGKPLGEVLVAQQLVSEGEVRSGLELQKEMRTQRLGEILEAQHAITHDQLRQSLERQRSMPLMRLGDALVESGRISAQQLEEALGQQKNNRQKQLGEILVDLGHLSRADLYRALSQKLGIPAVDLSKVTPEAQAVQEIPDALAREMNVVPLCFDGKALVVAMSNPLDPRPAERIRFVTQRAVRPVLASPESIAAGIRAAYGLHPREQRAEELASKLFSESAETGDEENLVKETDNTLVKLVNKIVMDAHAAGASDIHVESHPGRKNVSVRFRRDGVLAEYLQMPFNFRSAIVSRLKIMASLDISEHRRPQDGRINFRQFGPANVDLRIATVPTQDGLEDVVMRLLNAGEPLPLARLGVREPVRAALETLIGRSFGMVLVCGPTGSGKTTTLHSLLAFINSPERKIWTAEDPVEISQAGLRQVQMNARIGWTFAAALRSFLRADPDVIMVGEMRDAETASVAIEASLTGHLVLSTLHTNSAPETVVRLLEMGMDPFSFADSLAGILAQRLARRLCEACRTARETTPDEQAELVREYCLGSPLDPERAAAELRSTHGAAWRLYSPKGCEQCRGTGYRGRVGLHELLIVEPDLRQLIQRRAPASELRAAAQRTGMRTLRQDGIEKCLTGATDLAEVRAVA